MLVTNQEKPKDDQQAERETIRKEVLAEFRRESWRRRLWGCGGCLFFTLLLVGVPTFFVARAVAQTGMIQIPAMTKRYYRPAMPLRNVQPVNEPSQTAMAEAIVSGRSGYDPAVGKLPVKIDERLLTRMAQEALVGQTVSGASVKRAQIAVDPEFLELFVASQSEATETTWAIRLVPRVENGGLTFDLSDVKIGAFAVPHWLNGTVSSLATKAMSGDLGAALSQAGAIQDVRLEEKRLLVEFIVGR